MGRFIDLDDKYDGLPAHRVPDAADRGRVDQPRVAVYAALPGDTTTADDPWACPQRADTGCEGTTVPVHGVYRCTVCDWKDPR